MMMVLKGFITSEIAKVIKLNIVHSLLRENAH